MAIIKCKICGGDLNVLPEMTVVKCEYCGTNQTLPRLSDDRRTGLYNRANHYRQNSDYDRAQSIYEQILNEDTSDAEAYWSLVLCQYGIEYVEDPKTHTRIPTVNRAQNTPVKSNSDFKCALEYADDAQRRIYIDEANKIDTILSEIIEVSAHDTPYDIFICYKETDEQGQRTIDSVRAQDLYDILTAQGYKVYFSRVTLEDKLGQKYEPYIFSAINSAKIMLVIGSKPEYFNAVWVKNEWKRYLQTITAENGKLLIPCYINMNPYDLPDELVMFQSQDMNKIGFQQDLLRGLSKVLSTQEPRAIINPPDYQSASADSPKKARTLVELGFLDYNLGKYDSATAQFRQAIQIDDKCAEAYLGLAMIPAQNKNPIYLKRLQEFAPDMTEYEKSLITSETAYDFLIVYLDIKAYQRIDQLLDDYPELVERALGNDNNRYYFLDAAVSNYKSARAVEVFLKHGANPNKTCWIDNSGKGRRTYTALVAATYLNDLEIVRLLLENGGNPNVTDLYEYSDGRRKQIPLIYYAIKYKHRDIAELLIEYGANVDAVYQTGRGELKSLLYSALEENQLDIFKCLLDSKADVNQETILIDDRGNGLKTFPLRCAIDMKNIQVVEMLLNHGANARATFQTPGSPQYQSNMLAEAILTKNVDMVALLLSHGASWEDNITYLLKSPKPLERYPFHKIEGLSNDKAFLRSLKDLGWKGSLF